MEKPEHMTSLKNNKLVQKDSDIIIFRGKLDSFQAEIILNQKKCKNLGNKELDNELNNLLLFTQGIMRAEVLNEEINCWEKLGEDEKKIRDMSHHPKKYFSFDHFICTADNDECVVLLNKLRTLSRELEISGVRALKKRDDILKALNRISSFIYVLMLKYYSKQ